MNKPEAHSYPAEHLEDLFREHDLALMFGRTAHPIKDVVMPDEYSPLVEVTYANGAKNWFSRKRALGVVFLES
jgi:hypothetical protein